MTHERGLRRIECMGQAVMAVLVLVATQRAVGHAGFAESPSWVEVAVDATLMLLLPVLFLLKRWWGVTHSQARANLTELILRRGHEEADELRVGEIRERVRLVLGSDDGL